MIHTHEKYIDFAGRIWTVWHNNKMGTDGLTEGLTPSQLEFILEGKIAHISEQWFAPYIKNYWKWNQKRRMVYKELEPGVYATVKMEDKPAHEAPKLLLRIGAEARPWRVDTYEDAMTTIEDWIKRNE